MASLPFLSPAPKGLHETVGFWLALIFMSGIFLVPTTCLALWTLRARIIADETGLRWRGLFGSWRSVSWGEVTDYYERLELRQSSQPWPMIVEASGRQIKFDKDWSDVKSLRTVIQAQATGAHASGGVSKARGPKTIGRADALMT